jgi:hypothetical protein
MIKDYVSFRSNHELLEFLFISQGNNKLARGVKHLQIWFRGEIPAFLKLRQCLRLFRNIISLQLDIPHRSPAPIWLFAGVFFPRLRTFRTKSVRHSALVDLLDRHRRIRTIALGICGKTKHCPITDANIRFLAAVNVTSPSYCAAEILDAIPTVHLRSTLHLDRDFSTPVQHVLRSSPSNHPLKSLHLDINPSDLSFMHSIVGAAPRLEYLEIREKLPHRLPSVRTYHFLSSFIIASLLTLPLTLAATSPDPAPSLE